MIAEYQAHNGSVGTGTPGVQYTYSDGYSDTSPTSRPAPYVRLTDVTYPNENREVGYNYAAGVDNIMSRLTSLFEDTNRNGILDISETVESSYKYLGASQIVKETDAGATLSYLDSADSNVTGLDRFGRVVDQIWRNSADEVLDHYTYQYDRVGNVTRKTNELKTDGSLNENV